MKALKLLREQKEENLKNRPLYCSLKDFHKYRLEKICIFNDAIEELEDFIKESKNKEKGVKTMTEKEAISILAEVIPKGSDDFERLWKLYGNFCYKGDKRIAIDVFENKWKNFNMEALEKVINMYIKHIKETGAYKYSFASFLDYELENFIQDRQIKSEEQEKVNLRIGEIK